jgi:hypothetical protein
MKTLRHFLLLALAVSPTSVLGHESPIDHVERELRLCAEEGRVRLVYRLLPTERATLVELKSMDADGDGTISGGEREAFFAGKAQAIAKRIELTIDEQPLPLEPNGSVRCDPQLGQTYVFSVPVPKLASGRHPGKLVDGHSRDYPGGYVWKEPGHGGPGAIRFEPVAPATDRRSPDHPPWLELQFNVLVP